MSELQIKTINEIKELDVEKLNKVLEFVLYIKKLDIEEIPNEDTIASFIEGENLLNDPETKYYNSIDELRHALGI